MLKREVFGANIEAYVRFAQARGREGVPILREELARDGWGRNPIPRTWLTAATSLGAFPRLQDSLVDRLLRADVTGPDEGVREILVDVLGGLAPSDAHGRNVERLVSWLLTTVAEGPGEASLVADATERLLLVAPNETWLPERAQQLASWLVRWGSAELRTARRAQLLTRLINAVATLPGSAGTQIQLLRHLRVNERSWECWLERDADGAIWRAIESGLTTGALSRTFVSDFMRLLDRLGHRMLDLIFAPFALEKELPLSRTALFQCLERGEVGPSIAPHAWRQVICAPPPPSLSIQVASGLTLALDVLNLVALEAQARLDQRHHVGPPADLDRWVVLLYGNWIAVHGFGRRRDAATNPSRLELAAATPLLAPGVYEAISAHLDVVEDAAFGLAKQVAAQVSKDAAGALAVVTALPTRTRSTRREDLDVEFLESELSRVLTGPVTERIGLIEPADLMRGASRVALDVIGGRDLVCFRGDTIVVDRDAIRGVWAAAESREHAVVDCLLFFAHELVHVWQGVGDHETIQEIRAVGSEPTIVHLDLAADHAAATLVATATRRWSFAELRDRQGRGLSAFAARRDHTTAARARKAARLIGLRVDFLGRDQFECSPSEYLFADYGLTGGPFLLLASGPPMRVVGIYRSLSVDQAALFERAADEGQLLADVDRALSDVLSQVQAGKT